MEAGKRRVVAPPSLGAVKGAHRPASIEGGADDIVPNQARGAQDEYSHDQPCGSDYRPDYICSTPIAQESSQGNCN
jgi:hypothetical protein